MYKNTLCNTSWGPTVRESATPTSTPNKNFWMKPWSGFYLLGEAGGKLSPLTAQLPPQMVSTYYIRLAFLSSIMPALITQESKFSLFKFSQVIKCFSFHALCRREHIPLSHPPPTATLSMMASPPNFES